MGKKKKITEKVRLFYRGPLREPTKIADEGELQIIADALKDILSRDSQKNYAFKTLWCGKELTFKVLFGLKSTLRCLKRKQTRALIYDETASDHFKNFLNEFAFKLGLPIIQARNLSVLAGNPKLPSLLVLSVVDANLPTIDIYRSVDPKPKPIDDIVISEKIDKLFQFLQAVPSRITRVSFKPPVIDKVISTGKNRAKKEAKKEAKKSIKEAKKKEASHSSLA